MEAVMLNLKFRYYIWDSAEHRDAIKTRYTDEDVAKKALERLRRKHPTSPYSRFTIFIDAKRDGRKRKQHRPSIVYVGD
jgi:hypothetical protein